MIQIGTYSAALYSADTLDALLDNLAQSKSVSQTGAASLNVAIVFHNSHQNQSDNGLEYKKEIVYKKLLQQKQDGLKPIYDHDVGIFFEPEPFGSDSLAFVFPGQGSQYLNMLKGYLQQSVFNRSVNEFDQIAHEIYGKSLKDWVFPPLDSALNEIEGTFAAQSLIGFVSACMARLINEYGIRATQVAGHSYGELTALWYVGALKDSNFMSLTAQRGRVMEQASEKVKGGMLAIAADESAVREILNHFPRVEIANLNTPKQTVVGGPTLELINLQKYCEQMSIRSVVLKTASAFHTSYMDDAIQPWTEYLQELEQDNSFNSNTTIPVIANVTSDLYFKDRDSSISSLLTAQMRQKVRWVDTCQKLYENGARIFVEIGPGNTLTRMFKQNLAGYRHLALHSDPLNKEPNQYLAQLIAQLAVHGLTQKSTIKKSSSTLMEHTPINTMEVLQSFFSENGKIINQYFQLVGKMVDEIDQKSQEAIPTLLHLLNQSTKITTDYLSAHERGLDIIQGLSIKLKEPVIDAQTLRNDNSKQDNILMHKEGVLTQAEIHNKFKVPQQIDKTTIQVNSSTEPNQKEQLATWLIQQVSAITGFPEAALDVKSEFSDLGIDSLAFTELFEKMSQNFPITTDQAKLLFSAKSISDVIHICCPVIKLDPEDQDESPVQTWLLKQLTGMTGFQQDQIDLDFNFDDLGIDSLGRSQLIVSLVENFPEYKSHITNILNCATPNEVLEILQNEKNQKNIDVQHIEKQTNLTVTNEVIENETSSLEAVQHKVYIYLTEKGHNYSPSQDINFDEIGLTAFERFDLWENIILQDQSFALAGEALMSCSCLSEAIELLKGFNYQQTQQSPTHQIDQLERYTLNKVERKLIQAPELPKHILLIGTGDNFYLDFEKKLKDHGINVEKLLFNDQQWSIGENTVSLEDYMSLKGVLDLLTQRVNGQDHSLIFLTPENPSVLNEQESWANRLDHNAMALFALSKAFDLSETMRNKYQSLGVVLTVAHDSADIVVRGMARSLSHEWKKHGSHVSSISLSNANESDPIKVIQNLTSFQDQHDLEMDGNTLYEMVFESKKELTDSYTLPLTQDSIVLLYGGGVGITAEIGVDLARRYNCKIIALGRTDWHGENPFQDAKDTELASLVYQELQQLKPDQKVESSTLQLNLKRVKRQRDLAMTAKRIQEAGGQFEYICADVTNQHDVYYAISQIHNKWGNIDVVIHAAGIVEDNSLSEKTAESFRRVLNTKAHSALYLYNALKASPPKLIAFFSSLVAHTGNTGQSDYSAANEVLSAIAKKWTQQDKSVRTVTYLWSVWTETGLANQAVQRMLKKHELAGISTTDGIRYFHAELSNPLGSEQVLITSPRTLNILSEGLWH